MATRLTKIQWHYGGFNELRKSAAVAGELQRRGKAIAEAAGGEQDFAVESSTNGSRARVVVVTSSVDGMLAEATERALTNALNAGRG